jgi:HPt (histidine-containing phosphotransfer) domain-containing protein
MDHMMPEMDGLETTAEIRKLERERQKKDTSDTRKRIPIIALTANAVQGSREMFLENDMDDFLSKPIEMPVLARLLSEWLPPEKVTIETDAGSKGGGVSDGEKSAFLPEALTKISEIDTESGLRRVSGRKDMYLNNLKLFKDRIVADNEKMAVCLNSWGIKDFSITVHAIKSALASIGAEQLSNVALGLETASHGGDIDYCVKQFPSFSKRLAALYEDLALAFQSVETETQDKKGFESEEDAAAFFKENMQKALEAVDDFDTDAGLEALNNALTCNNDDTVNALLENAIRALKQYKYNEAKDILLNIN